MNAGTRQSRSRRYGSAMRGRGAHICAATFVVGQTARSQGVGRSLVVDFHNAAKASCYRTVQFNQVMSINTAALALYRSPGFIETGCLPDGFRHDRLWFVSAYIMYRSWSEAACRRAAGVLGPQDQAVLACAQTLPRRAS